MAVNEYQWNIHEKSGEKNNGTICSLEWICAESIRKMIKIISDSIGLSAVF